MSRPLIGYTTKDNGNELLHLLIALSIRIAGGKPVALRPSTPKYDHKLDGLVIAGGTDINPELYNRDKKDGYVYDFSRDTMEMTWLDKAEEYNLPILGICRGAQLMNVTRGGSLFLDVSKAVEKAEYPSGAWASIFYRKAANIKGRTFLHKLIGDDRVRINSMHKQAINELGRGLIVSAVEDNGVVQAVEDPSRKFYLGVQFHPEAMIYHKIYRSIFKALVNASRG